MIGRSARIIDGRMKFGSMSIGDDNALMIPRVSRNLLWRSPRKVSREQKEKKKEKGEGSRDEYSVPSFQS